MVPSKIFNDYTFFPSVFCNCTTPGQGIGYSKNKMTCTDGSIAYCSSNEECYATESFDYGQLDIACRIPGNYIESKYIFSMF